MKAPGHESGHAQPVPAHAAAEASAPPVGFSWETVVLAFVSEAGGWAALSDELLRRTRGVAAVPSDPHVVEKGLRRLAKRGQKPGGQYGRWLLRYFGVPASLERWAEWMGQFHSRFADLPTSLRFEQLNLWDRPPVTESRLAAWVHVGMASVLLRMRLEIDATRRLELAEASAAQAGTACQVEVALLRAKLLTDAGDRDGSRLLFERIEAWLTAPELSTDARACYHARLIGQRAYHLTRALPGSEPDVSGALELFQQIHDEPFIPFVAFRKSNGVAYCRWRLGDTAAGIAEARRALQHAGDGGLVRFRIMALNLLARMLPEAESSAVRQRAETLSRLVEDDDLLRRLRVPWR
ncbi:MAG TPA: hypothetical protein VI197_20695 [Polyangiaceae bacterium]